MIILFRRKYTDKGSLNDITWKDFFEEVLIPDLDLDIRKGKNNKKKKNREWISVWGWIFQLQKFISANPMNRNSFLWKDM